MIDGALNILVGLLLLSGAFFCLVASIGLLRLPDLYTRMHAASKAGTVGSGMALVAMAIHSANVGDAARAMAGVIFFILTAPVSAHLLAKAAHDMGYPLWRNSVRDDKKASDEGKDENSH
ncbi:monovalent cation/H(+) antiporter subunit G [Notoacmeibacter ruber]|uniref:Monovalent cation/H(+) antiporter subunit G n=1 Tax=Notoacmeibacter ruber TaxID=2670375 RepID=A0A3L7J9T7_9HYPH|nr:monovalent cation/H(+) antiporter subunit G [Notoacmeibacter ruber]RLQ87518.1 monovalent cation/H(+) antiporter subunit G [Notoacmeibacter ruber]